MPPPPHRQARGTTATSSSAPARTPTPTAVTKISRSPASARAAKAAATNGAAPGESIPTSLRPHPAQKLFRKNILESICPYFSTTRMAPHFKSRRESKRGSVLTSQPHAWRPTSSQEVRTDPLSTLPFLGTRKRGPTYKRAQTEPIEKGRRRVSPYFSTKCLPPHHKARSKD